MAKRLLISVGAVFIVWSVMDFVIHGVLLGGWYQETASMWRPEAEMKYYLMHIITLVYSFTFVYIYDAFFSQKNMTIGLKYGAISGFGLGMWQGYGSYAFMPIPYKLAFAWFAGAFVELIVAGLIVGLLCKE